MYIALIALVFSIIIYFLPVWSLRDRTFRTSNDRVVSSFPAEPGTFQSASVAYSFQMAILGPFFVWGLTRDTLGALLNSLAFFVGLLVLWFFRRQLVTYFVEQLGTGKSVTVHEFIGRQFKSSRLVTVTAALVTILGVLGIVVAEMLGLAAIVSEMFPLFSDATSIVLVIIFFLMLAYTIIGGNDGAMLSASLQLRLVYVSLVVFAIAMLVGPTAQQHLGYLRGTLVATVICAIFLALAHWISRPSLSSHNSASKFANRLRKFDWMLAMAACLLLIALAAYASYLAVTLVFDGSSSAESWIANRSIPTIGLFALVILPVCFQFIDIANWQKLAATKRAAGDIGVSRALLGYAVEAPLVQVFSLLLGGMMLIDPAFAASETFPAFVKKLFASDVISHRVAVAALVVAAFAIAMSTIDSAFSSATCAFLSDIRPNTGETGSRQIRRGIVVLSGIFFGAVLFIAVAGNFFAFGSQHFVTLLLSFYGAQLSFVPIVLRGLLFRTASPLLPPIIGIAVLVGGTSASLGCAAYGLLAGDVFWGWMGIPLSLGISFVILLSGVAWQRRKRTPEVRHGGRQ